MSGCLLHGRGRGGPTVCRGLTLSHDRLIRLCCGGCCLYVRVCGGCCLCVRVCGGCCLCVCVCGGGLQTGGGLCRWVWLRAGRTVAQAVSTLGAVHDETALLRAQTVVSQARCGHQNISFRFPGLGSRLSAVSSKVSHPHLLHSSVTTGGFTPPSLRYRNHGVVCQSIRSDSPILFRMRTVIVSVMLSSCETAPIVSVALVVPFVSVVPAGAPRKEYRQHPSSAE